jgi:hypothetical protein
MRTVVAAACAIIVLVCSMGAAEMEQSLSLDAADQGICGPRAVQQVLSHFGIPEELHRLVAEMQPGHSGNTTSLDTIQKALEKRGLHTAAYTIGNSVNVRWKEPVILLLILANGDGHFAVQLPEDSDYRNDQTIKNYFKIWVGPNDIREMSSGELEECRSRTVLLTSSNVIVDGEKAFLFPTVWERIEAAGAIIAGPVAAVLALLVFSKRRRKQCVTQSAGIA